MVLKLKLELKFKTDNAAFGCDSGIEVGRILQEIGLSIIESGIIDGGVVGSIWDVDGNIIGYLELNED